MKSKRYSAIEAAAKIIEMESDDSDYDVQDDKSEVSWSENVTEDTDILKQTSENVERYGL